MTPQLGEFEATNPCGEQWLLPTRAATSVRSTRHFIRKGEIDYKRLKNVARTATDFLDNVIDCNRFPIPEIAEMTLKTRKIGMGIMGLHDMLIQLAIRMAAKKGGCCAKVMQFIRDTAEERSISWPGRKGPFRPTIRPSTAILPGETRP